MKQALKDMKRGQYVPAVIRYLGPSAFRVVTVGEPQTGDPPGPVSNRDGTFVMSFRSCPHKGLVCPFTAYACDDEQEERCMNAALPAHIRFIYKKLGN